MSGTLCPPGTEALIELLKREGVIYLPPVVIRWPKEPKAVKRKILRIDTILFPALFRNEPVTWSGMPDDAKIIDVRFDGFMRNIDVCVESDTFDEVPEGQQLPHLIVTGTRRAVVSCEISDTPHAYICADLPDVPEVR